MGGLYGHIHHIYDKPELKFSDIKNIYNGIIFNKIETFEKTDGQNIFFSYSLPKRQVLFARNKTNIKNGGLILDDILEKWSENKKVLSSFELAYKVLETSLNKLNNEQLEKIFGNSNQYWFSAEIINKLNPNVIHYNRNLIILHESCYTFDESGNKSISLKEIKTRFNNVCCTVGKTDYLDWEIWKPVSIELNLKNQKKLFLEHIFILNQFMLKNNLQNGDTVKDFIKISCSNFDELSKKNQMNVSKIVLEPLEKLTFNFACNVLSKQKSLICTNSDNEINRLHNYIKNELKAINGAGVHENIILAKTLFNKIKNINNVDCPMEGITFNYKNNVYKLTGYFSLINSILGIRRYAA